MTRFREERLEAILTMSTVAPAALLFAGGVAQSIAGLVQVNLRVPEWVKAGSAVRVYLQIGNNSAELGVTLAVR